jgi:hypothetical protein
MAEPKTKKAPETDAAPDAEKTPDGAPSEERVDPVELTVREEREPRSYADRMERELRMPRSAEGAVIISALVELHRIGLHDGTADGRYLKAARVIGDSLVEEILGPADR